MEDLLRGLMLNPNRMNDREFWRQFQSEDFGSAGAGSGVVVDVREGWAYVVTNAHVLEEGERVAYRIALDSSFDPDEPVIIEEDEVAVVGRDPLTDIAVLKFRPPEGVTFPPIKFADSDKVQVGEWVLALGNPLELNNSVSQGIVSGMNRRIGKTDIESLLQTTAVINPGNSGGPLVNLDGDIIGINNAIATSTGRWAGVGFAIPSNQARRVADAFIRTGKLERGFLGVTMEEVSEGWAEALELGKSRGVLVKDVRPDTPAQIAGIAVGDIITEVDDRKVRTPADLLGVIGNRFAGDRVSVKLMRYQGASKEELSVTVELMARPGEAELRSRLEGGDTPRIEGEGAPLRGQGVELEGYGLSVEPLGGADGLRVVRVERGGLAWQAGLAPDDVIVQVNGFAVATLEELGEALDNVRRGRKHMILAERAGTSNFLTMSQVP
jgi:serine protease Do